MIDKIAMMTSHVHTKWERRYHESSVTRSSSLIVKNMSVGKISFPNPVPNLCFSLVSKIRGALAIDFFWVTDTWVLNSVKGIIYTTRYQIHMFMAWKTLFEKRGFTVRVQVLTSQVRVQVTSPNPPTILNIHLCICIHDNLEVLYLHPHPQILIA